jgi:hypothetical protein
MKNISLKNSNIALYGFTFIKNGVKYDYPFLESLKSMAPLCEKIVVAHGDSEDNTRDELLKIKDLHILESSWDKSLLKGHVLSVETNKSLEELRKMAKDLPHFESAWAIYLQGDECLHEEDFQKIISDIELANSQGFDALSFHYLHFWQSHYSVCTAKRWYSSEVRAIKLKSDIVSWGDAQGFKNIKKNYLSSARIFHYGHVRDPGIYVKKMEDMSKLYSDLASESKYFNKKSREKVENHRCVSFFGTHPSVMSERILRLEGFVKIYFPKKLRLLGSREDYDPTFLLSLEKYFNSTLFEWVKPWSLRGLVFYIGSILRRTLIVHTRFSYLEFLFCKTRVPKKMRYKNSPPFTPEMYLVLKCSEKVSTSI